MPAPLLATKLFCPPPRPGLTPRPRLLARLQAGLGVPLTLVSAQAGSGKSMLLSQWRAGPGAAVPVAWLALDAADNDPLRFFQYLVAALETASPGVQAEAAPLLQSSELFNAADLLTLLCNRLSACEQPFLLALDDYHLIESGEIHAALGFLLERMPPAMHIALLTRADPPLPLARLRARGQLVEIRAAELRFTLAETHAFLNQAMGLSLTTGQVSTLEQRTEGWVTALQLAALALQNLPEPQAFIETFRGSHRFVLDYLAEEVVRQQDTEIRQFLSGTSVLERFNAELCTALTGRSDSQALLHRLEAANLFLIPLDGERAWYRYHHLFADYLRAGLAQAEAAELHQKAAVWHAGQDLVFDAMRHALSSGDGDFAAGMMERLIEKGAAWSGGNMTTLIGWLEAIPRPALLARPRLALHASRILYLSGRFNQAEALLEQVSAALADQSAPEAESLLALAALYRGGIAGVRGQVRQALEQTRFAQAHLPPGDQLLQARAAFSLGSAYELSGELAAAEQAYFEASRLAHAGGVLYLAVNACCAAAITQKAQGKPNLAAATCQQAIALAGGQRIPPLGLAYLLLGVIACEQDDLAAAESLMQDGQALARQGGLIDDLDLGVVYQARLKFAQGDIDGSLAALDQAATRIQAFGIPRLTCVVEAYAARLQLAAGQLEKALPWGRRYQVERSIPVEYLREFEDLTLARLHLAAGELPLAQPLVDRVLESTLAGGRMETGLEALLVHAQVALAHNDTPAALARLEQALRFAASAGYLRTFLENGPALLPLLPRVRAAAPQLVDRLLSRSPAVEKSPPPQDALLDPLSEQELRVLKLVVAGKSNQEIAAALVISPGTAKWHVHNVLQKLGVSNRPQAIARAHQLGLDS